MRIDDGGDSVCGVVESIDELEPQRDEQCKAKQHVWPGADDVHTGDVTGEMEPGIAKSGKQNSAENQRTNEAWRFFDFPVEKGFCRRQSGGNDGRGCFIHSSRLR